MIRIWESIKKGYLRLIEPVAALLIRNRVSREIAFGKLVQIHIKIATQ